MGNSISAAHRRLDNESVYSADMLFMRISHLARDVLFAARRVDWPWRLTYIQDYDSCQLVDGMSIHYEPANNPNVLNPGRFFLMVDGKRVWLHDLYDLDSEQETISITETSVFLYNYLNRIRCTKSDDKIAVYHSIYHHARDYFRQFAKRWREACEHSAERESFLLGRIRMLDFQSIRQHKNSVQTFCEIASSPYGDLLSKSVSDFTVNLNEVEQISGMANTLTGSKMYHYIMKKLSSLIESILALSTLRTLTIAGSSFGRRYRAMIAIDPLLTEVTVTDYMVAVFWKYLDDRKGLMEWLRQSKRYSIYQNPPQLSGLWYGTPIIRALDGEIDRVVDFINRLVSTNPAFAGVVPSSEHPVSIYL